MPEGEPALQLITVTKQLRAGQGWGVCPDRQADPGVLIGGRAVYVLPHKISRLNWGLDLFVRMSVLYHYICDVSHIYKDFLLVCGK